jgi:hypothetical protein
MNLILEISNEQDAVLILNLVKRLNIKFKKEKNINSYIEYPSIPVQPEQDSLLMLMSKPMMETLDVEALKRTQNWQGPDQIGMMKLIDEMDVREPIEELLAQLSA